MFMAGPSPLKPLHRGAAISSRKSFAARAAICLGVRIESFGSIFSSRAGISANVLARDLMIVRAVCAACAAWAACAVASGGGRRSIRDGRAESALIGVAGQTARRPWPSRVHLYALGSAQGARAGLMNGADRKAVKSELRGHANGDRPARYLD
jgi:hypothetical protein